MSELTEVLNIGVMWNAWNRLGARRHFLFTSFCCSKEVKARAA